MCVTAIPGRRPQHQTTPTSKKIKASKSFHLQLEKFDRPSSTKPQESDQNSEKVIMSITQFKTKQLIAVDDKTFARSNWSFTGS